MKTQPGCALAEHQLNGEGEAPWTSSALISSATRGYTDATQLVPQSSGAKNSRALREKQSWKSRSGARSFSGLIERLEDRRLLTVLNIFGDQDYVGENDTIVLKRNSGDPTKLDVTLNASTTQYTLASISQINVFGLAGNDNLTVDSSNGLISVADGINFDGGGGFDYLSLQQTGGPSITSDHLDIGATAGSGISTIVGGATQTVYFQNIEPIFDFVPSVNLIIERSGFFPSSILDGNNAINYSTGFAPGVGRVTIDNFEPILFGTKDHLVIDAGAGDDVINLNNPNVPTGNSFATLQDITIIGNDPTASDKLIVNGTSGFDTINYKPSATIGAGSVQVNALPTVFFTTIESLVIDGQGGNDQLTYTTPVNSGLGSVLTFTPGNAGDSATVSGRRFAGPDLVPMTYQNVGIGATLTFATADTGPYDYLDFFGTAAPDKFDLNPFNGGTINVTRFGQPSLSTTIEVHAGSVSTLALHGLEGDDLFNLAGPLFYSRLVIDGGGPSASDIVNFSGANGPVTVNLADATLATNTLITGYGGPITLIGDEVVNLDLNGQTLTVIGTAQPDSITYTPTGTLAGTFTLAGLNTVFNFTDVSDGSVGFVIDPMGGADTVTVNGTSGDDDITASVNGTNTFVQVGGLQTVAIVTANTESLMIAGGNGDDDLRVDASGGPVLIPIVYDGGTGRDSLSLTGGAAGNDTYSPGPIRGSGTSIINYTSGGGGVQIVNFQNLEPVYDDVTADTAIVNGTDANNAIDYRGANNDTPQGLVTVDDQEGYYFSNKTHLVINAGAGDDVINLNNPGTSPGLMDITVNGGDPTASDTLIVNGTSAADTIDYSPSATIGAARCKRTPCRW